MGWMAGCDVVGGWGDGCTHWAKFHHVGIPIDESGPSGLLRETIQQIMLVSIGGNRGLEYIM